MSHKTAVYSYKIDQQGHDKVFTYKKAKFGARMYVAFLWPSLILGIFLAIKTTPSANIYSSAGDTFTTGIFYTIAYTLLVPLIVITIMNLIRQPDSFTLKKDGIFLDGSLYPYSDIAEIYIKSGKGEVSNSVSKKSGFLFAMGGDRVNRIGLGAATATATAVTGVANAASQMSNQAGRSIAKNWRANNHKISFLFGNSEVTLASGMTEIQSIHLLRSVTGQQG